MNCPVADGATGWMSPVVSAGARGMARRWMGRKPTVRFWQEIYDDTGRLVETHEKFPVDGGHRKV